jgi:predicted ATPase
MIHLKYISFQNLEHINSNYPFSLPIIQTFAGMEFTSPVSFFVGENGSGKTTLLEVIACAIDSIVVGSESLKTDKTLGEIQRLSRFLRLSWNKRTHKGFFLRAEDFFGYAKKLSHMRQELEDDLHSVEQEYTGRSKMAVDLARSPHLNELNAMTNRYGESLDNRSHGEAFLALFQARFVPGGLYLLDEPEAPLSPLRQLALISIIKEMLQKDAQFIIATHSPILMAFPDAVLFNFDHSSIHPVEYSDLEHVNLMRSFLNDPQAYLRQL